MKFRMIILILAFISVITGCTDVVKKENQLTLDKVILVLKTEVPELSETQIQGEPVVLNNVRPNAFYIKAPRGPLEDRLFEGVHVYIFNSEQTRIDGLITFNKHLETAKLAWNLKVYERKNALVIYYSYPGEDTKFGEKIQKGMEKL